MFSFFLTNRKVTRFVICGLFSKLKVSEIYQSYISKVNKLEKIFKAVLAQYFVFKNLQV